MGAKKKGLANRLAKMSDEERARYMQHRADMEEEARRRKEQLLSTFMKNKLRKEDAFSRLNVAKLNQNWHQIMRKIKCSDMKEEVEYLQERVQRILDLKDRTIDRILLELEEAEEQYNNNFQAHLNHIADMIEFGRKSVDEMTEEYEEERSTLIEEWKKERGAFIKKAVGEIVYLKTIIYDQDEVGRKQLRENYEYYFQRSDDVVRENKSDFDALRRSKESAVGALWGEIASLLRGHVESSDARRAHLAELRTLDAESAAEITSNEALMRRQEVEIAELEDAWEEIRVSGDDEIRGLKKIIETIRRDYLQSKNTLKTLLDKDEKKILYLTQCSEDTVKHLEKLMGKGERVLQLMQICRKLETQEEKVCRFIQVDCDSEDGKYLVFDDDSEGVIKQGVEIMKPVKREVKRISKSAPISRSSTSSVSKKFDEISQAVIKRMSSATSKLPPITRKSSSSSTISQSSLEEDEEGPIEGCFSVINQLDNLWTGYNHVVISLVGMREEKKFLEQENEKLKVQLRVMLEEIAVQKVAERLDEKQSMFFVRDIHSADKIYAQHNVKLVF